MHIPTPSPHPTDGVEAIKAKFLWSFNFVLEGEEGGVMDFENESILFITLLVIHIDWLLLCFYCLSQGLLSTIVHYKRRSRDENY